MKNYFQKFKQTKQINRFAQVILSILFVGQCNAYIVHAMDNSDAISSAGSYTSSNNQKQMSVEATPQDMNNFKKNLKGAMDSQKITNSLLSRYDITEYLSLKQLITDTYEDLTQPVNLHLTNEKIYLEDNKYAMRTGEKHSEKQKMTYVKSYENILSPFCGKTGQLDLFDQSGISYTDEEKTKIINGFTQDGYLKILYKMMGAVLAHTSSQITEAMFSREPSLYFVQEGMLFFMIFGVKPKEAYDSAHSRYTKVKTSNKSFSYTSYKKMVMEKIARVTQSPSLIWSLTCAQNLYENKMTVQYQSPSQENLDKLFDNIQTYDASFDQVSVSNIIKDMSNRMLCIKLDSSQLPTCPESLKQFLMPTDNNGQSIASQQHLRVLSRVFLVVYHSPNFSTMFASQAEPEDKSISQYFYPNVAKNIIDSALTNASQKKSNQTIITNPTDFVKHMKHYENVLTNKNLHNLYSILQLQHIGSELIFSSAMPAAYPGVLAATEALSFCLSVQNGMHVIFVQNISTIDDIPGQVDGMCWFIHCFSYLVDTNKLDKKNNNISIYVLASDPMKVFNGIKDKDVLKHMKNEIKTFIATHAPSILSPFRTINHDADPINKIISLKKISEGNDFTIYMVSERVYKELKDMYTEYNLSGIVERHNRNKLNNLKLSSSINMNAKLV